MSLDAGVVWGIEEEEDSAVVIEGMDVANGHNDRVMPVRLVKLTAV